MRVPLDYKELLSALNRSKVRYLVIGAYAVTYYTEPRYTKDIDIWVGPDTKNAQRVYTALKEFGAPLQGITVKDFSNPKMVYQIGVAPVRADIMMSVSGVKFKTAWQHKKIAPFNGIKINIIGIKELIRIKEKTGRPLDAADTESLRLRLKLGAGKPQLNRLRIKKK